MRDAIDSRQEHEHEIRIELPLGRERDASCGHIGAEDLGQRGTSGLWGKSRLPGEGILEGHDRRIVGE